MTFGKHPIYYMALAVSASSLMHFAFTVKTRKIKNFPSILWSFVLINGHWPKISWVHICFGKMLCLFTYLGDAFLILWYSSQLRTIFAVFRKYEPQYFIKCCTEGTHFCCCSLTPEPYRVKKYVLDSIWSVGTPQKRGLLRWSLRVFPDCQKLWSEWMAWSVWFGKRLLFWTSGYKI